MTKLIGRMRPARRALLAVALLGMAGATASPVLAAQNAAKPAEPQLMFVQVSETMSSDPATKTVRLINVSPQTIHFRRPPGSAGRTPQDGRVS